MFRIAIFACCLFGPQIARVIRACLDEKEDCGDNSDPGRALDPPISASGADRITNRHSAPAFHSNYPSLNSAVKIRQETLPGHTTAPRQVSVSDPSQSSAVKSQEVLPGVLDAPIRASGGQVTVRQPVPAYPSSNTAVKIQPRAPPAAVDAPTSAWGAHTSTLPLPAFTSDASQNSAVKIECGALPGGLTTTVKIQQGASPSVVDVPISSFGGRQRINSITESLSNANRNSALKKAPGTLPGVFDVSNTALGGKATHFYPATDKYISVPAAISDPSSDGVIGNLQDHLPGLKAPIPHSNGRRAASHGYKSTADLLPFVKEPSSERTIGHYLSSQRVLLVGEGDFSFSQALATAFGSARNMVPTSLDSEETVLRQYKQASQTLRSLTKKGALVLHGVDATSMATHDILGMKSFDCIIFNFPHAGFHGPEDDNRTIRRHKRLVKLFFLNAAKLLTRNGEIHVSHKSTEPYTKWNLEEQAAMAGMLLKECSKFDRNQYPGYVNRRGAGPDCAQSFYLGESKTYKFILSPLLEGPLRPTPMKGLLQKGVVEGGGVHRARRKRTTKSRVRNQGIEIEFQLNEFEVVREIQKTNYKIKWVELKG